MGVKPVLLLGRVEKCITPTKKIRGGGLRRGLKACSSIVNDDVGVCMMRVYLRIEGSTHCGKSMGRACNAWIAASGFGADVETTKTTAY